jgi:nucleoside-diphosphate-sugar epimerase
MVAAAEAEASNVLGEVINLGCGEGRSIKRVVESVGNVLKQELIVETECARTRPDKSEVMHLESNPKKAETLLGWKSQYTFDDGLKKTIDYIRDNLEKYKPGYMI